MEESGKLTDEELTEVAGGSRPDPEEIEGEVVDILPNAKYRVKLCQTDCVIEAYLSGILRAAGRPLIAGDKVVVELSVYELKTGRIVSVIK